ncbi:MAG: UDP-N-acetylmuramoyl-L-alanyl-D-glutamate--2,6-diaminopimelate ligase [Actinomycetales bacterium]|nr:MAG: UDP-N-acetylmuramoyl-L-alanyl-D-glutamate--2,6-diaminopimelate ligase [Actinomycetales bacterium]
MPAPRPTSLPAVPLAELARLAEAHCWRPSCSGDLDIAPVDGYATGVSLDSRTVRPGDLYAALPGLRAHGADFANAAVSAGAVAVLTDPTGIERLDSLPGVPVLVCAQPRVRLGELAARIYGYPAEGMRIIGITGTNGKTTTAYLLETALRALGSATGLIGTVETRIGDRRLSSVRTTPEASDLHAILAVMREQGTDTVVMEVSSHAVSEHRVAGVVFDLALFTNLSQDHLDFHVDMADYFAAKAALFTPAHARRGLVCVDDEWGRQLVGRAGIPVTTLASVGRGQAAPASDWVVGLAPESRFTVIGPDVSLTLRPRLPGTFNVFNTALAAVALITMGYAATDVQESLSEVPVVPGRMEVVAGDSATDPRCIVDYAHTPQAVEAALAALRPSTPGRLVVVLGAGGDRDPGKRHAMGAAAARWADDLVITDDNPRSEDPAAIRREVLLGARESLPAEVTSEPADHPSRQERTVCSGAGRGDQIAHAVRLARTCGRAADNTVVVLGKGHERGQEIDGVVLPFDDRDALAAALRGRPYRPDDPLVPHGLEDATSAEEGRS